MDRTKMLYKAVLGLFRKKCSVFLSVMYCGLKVVWDDTIPTACVNGITLRINEGWFANMSDNMRVTVLGHELWHPALFHCDPWRAKGKDPRRWNEACDHAINLMMKEHGYEFSIDHLADPQYTGMSAEQIYRELDRKNEDPQLPFGEDFAYTPSENGSTAELMEVQALVVKATMATQVAGGKGSSDLPGSLLETIEKILRPKLPWDTILEKFLTAVSQQGYTWSRPNRRYQDVYLPSKGGPSGLKRIGWAFDESASMTKEQIGAFLDQIGHVQQLFQPEQMTIITFDDEVQSVYEAGLNFSFDKMEFRGRGGTLVNPVMEYVTKHKLDAVVFFTDMGYFDEPVNPKVPVLWICLDNPYADAPCGKLIHLDTTRDLPHS